MAPTSRSSFFLSLTSNSRWKGGGKNEAYGIRVEGLGVREESTGRRGEGHRRSHTEYPKYSTCTVFYCRYYIILNLLYSVHTVQYLDFSLQENDTFLWTWTVNVKNWFHTQ